MKAEDKAKELIVKFTQYTPFEFEKEYAKQCALICVDEIFNNNQFFLPDTRAEKYWQEVKKEIEKL